MTKVNSLIAGVVLMLIGCAPVRAQQEGTAINYEAESKVFRVDAGGVTYAFGINERGELQPLYWGARLRSTDKLSAAHIKPEHASFDVTSSVTPQEYAGWGAGLYVEPALKISFPDGNRDLVLHYVSHRIDGSSLTLKLKDVLRDVDVELRYQIDSDTGIIGRSAIVENATKEPLVIDQAAAATWTLPRGTDYSLTYLTGRWAGEWNLQHEAIRPGQRVLESRRGSTSHQNNPWFAVARGGAADILQQDQDSGEVWFGALAWSGSWRISVEQDQLQQVRVTGGFNAFDFGYRLMPGGRLETPVFYGGYTREGFGGASRLLHRFELGKILPQSPHPKPRPVIYNSWEATEFNVNEAGQEALAEKAASIGVERFVMDDGWFGERDNDHAGLGDWQVNSAKFPNGLAPLIQKVHSLGMDFGLWVEPEMVNPDSNLYRAHPDWVLNFPGRPRTEGRNQLVLNLARPDVREYVFNFLDKILKENDIAFLKWDYNRNWSEPGWDAVAPEDEKQVYVKYVENLYSILRQLRAAHPGVEIESCSGGGGRVDLGILRYTDEVWPSDNTDPFDRLTLQDGFTYAYTPGVMMAWVTDSPNGFAGRTTSLDYRFLSSMQGGLGVGANLLKWQPEDFATATRMITAYKQVRETVQHGSLYRLISPRGGSEHSVTESVAKDRSQAVVFAFLHSSQFLYPFPTIRLRGLEPEADYKLEWIEGRASRAPSVASGAYWMSNGIDLEMRGDFKAAAFRLERVQK
ncbi:MAG TPA: alpha-galactosidase [Acidisarcina sp.]